MKKCKCAIWWIDELMKKCRCVILKNWWIDELLINWWNCVILKIDELMKSYQNWWIDEEGVSWKTTIFTIFVKILKAITFNFPSISTIFVKIPEAPVEKACTAHTFQRTATVGILAVWNLTTVLLWMAHSPAYNSHCIRNGTMRECGYSDHSESLELSERGNFMFEYCQENYQLSAFSFKF